MKSPAFFLVSCAFHVSLVCFLARFASPADTCVRQPEPFWLEAFDATDAASDGGESSEAEAEPVAECRREVPEEPPLAPQDGLEPPVPSLAAAWPAFSGEGEDESADAPSVPAQRRPFEWSPPRAFPEPAETAKPRAVADDRARVVVQPSPVRRLPVPRYPRGSRRRGEEGTVVVEVAVGADGKVTDVRVAISSRWPELDRAAVAALTGVAFQPAETADGRTVAALARVPVSFRLGAARRGMAR